MIQTEASVTIRRPIEVVAFATDFERAGRWRIGLVEVGLVSPGYRQELGRLKVLLETAEDGR